MLTRLIESQIVDGGKYYGTVDWYVPDFYNEHGKGYVYIEVSKPYHESVFKMFQMDEDDVEAAKRIIEKPVDSGRVVPEFEPGDVVEFIASLDTANGCRAKHIKFFGLKNYGFVKQALEKQNCQFHLGKTAGEKTILKLVARPREKSNE